MVAIFLKLCFLNKFLLRILVGFIIPICASLSVANINHSTSNQTVFHKVIRLLSIH